MWNQSRKRATDFTSSLFICRDDQAGGEMMLETNKRTFAAMMSIIWRDDEDGQLCK